MTEDEQRFWDAAFIAIVAANEGVDDTFTRSVEGCEGIVCKMLQMRREKQKASTSA